MPHDRDGRPLRMGDIVNIPAKIIGIQLSGEEYCNLNLESIEPMYPGTAKSSLSLNSKQVLVARKALTQ